MRLALAALVLVAAGGASRAAEDRALAADPRYLERYDCVDRQSAAHLNHGSIELAHLIAEQCLSRHLSSYQSSYRLADVKRAIASAPNGVIVGLLGTVPGVMDIGDGGMLTIRAEENFDCRSVHPGEAEMVCNKPIDKAWIDENWPWWQKEFGGTRAEYDQKQLGFMLKDQERRQRLIAIPAGH